MHRMMISNRIFLVGHVPIRRRGSILSIDDQTCDGLIRWCENFGSVVYAGVELPTSEEEDISSTTWREVNSLPCAGRLKVLALPYAYKASEFVRHYRRTRNILAEEIKRSEFLCFALGGLEGDWAGVASMEAIKQGRKYAIWFDRIEHEVVRSDMATMPYMRRLKWTFSLPLMRTYHQHLVSRSSVGLFQGQDCYQYYRRRVANAYCMYDTHTQRTDFIDRQSLFRKLEGVGAGELLRICYAGRAAEMKGPLDWIEVLNKLKKANVAFQAVWMGDGPLLKRIEEAAAVYGLSECVDFAGFVGDRNAILSAMRDSHVFLFCHKTPESPRCLIESLVSGCPIAGYRSEYANDLVKIHGGGEFVEVGDIVGLAQLLETLDQDRGKLRDMIGSAARSGRRFDEERLYRERGDRIRRHL